MVLRVYPVSEECDGCGGTKRVLAAWSREDEQQLADAARVPPRKVFALCVLCLVAAIHALNEDAAHKVCSECGRKIPPSADKSWCCDAPAKRPSEMGVRL